MKKYIAGITALVMLFAFVFSGASLAEGKKVSVVTTIFPIYDWAREITAGNGNVEITMLLDSGVDLHSYQPTAADIMKIATCDVFIYVGGESDEWVEDALQEAVNPNMIVINLLECLGDDVKTEEIVEGMEHEHHEDPEEGDHGEDDHDHHDEDHHDEDHEHEDEADEHVWLSLRNAQKLVTAITARLAEADPVNADLYQANAVAYSEKLSALDAEFAAVTEQAAYNTILFGDRFPFRYLTDDYNLHYYAAFVGCSAETEASFATIVFLANKADELELSAICQIESSNGSIPRTIKENTHSKNQEILTFDSMQSTTSRDVANGASYLGIMEQNLETLKLALQ